MPRTELYCHFIWSTYDRLPLQTPLVEAAAYGHIAAKARALGASVLAIGGIEDHVHLVVRIPPHQAPARFVGQVKAVSSREVNRNGHSSAFRWQREYGAFSIGRQQLRSTIAYVQRQKHHHSNGDLIPTLEPSSQIPNPRRRAHS